MNFGCLFVISKLTPMKRLIEIALMEDMQLLLEFGTGNQKSDNTDENLSQGIQKRTDRLHIIIS